MGDKVAVLVLVAVLVAVYVFMWIFFCVVVADKIQRGRSLAEFEKKIARTNFFILRIRLTPFLVF